MDQGGPNGIVSVDPIRLFGYTFATNQSYYYLLVVILVVTMGVLRLLDTSRARPGRCGKTRWRRRR